MKKIEIELYGDACQIDTFDLDGELADCYVAMRDEEYTDITVRDGNEETEYSIDDLGGNLDIEWPDDIYDWKTDKFIDSTYAQFKGKSPDEVFKIEDKWLNCYLSEPEGELSKIEAIILKGHAFINIEIPEGETFDPKKFHFIYGEFVLPDYELEVNIGAVYDGKQYKIEVDPDSEEAWRETIWEAD